MMTLAAYEAFIPAEKRANIGGTIRRIEIEGKTMEDPLGNAMVDSTQQLSGLKKSKKKLKPKMPQSLSRGKKIQKKSSGGGRQRKKNMPPKAKTPTTMKLLEAEPKEPKRSRTVQNSTSPERPMPDKKSPPVSRKRKRAWSESTKSRSPERSTSKKPRYESKQRRSRDKRRYRSRGRSLSPYRSSRRRRRRTPPR